jgi:hypothetical protein
LWGAFEGLKATGRFPGMGFAAFRVHVRGVEAEAADPDEVERVCAEAASLPAERVGSPGAWIPARFSVKNKERGRGAEVDEGLEERRFRFQGMERPPG